MQHEDLRELVASYALDALPDADRAAIEQHLDVCPDCTGELAAFRAAAFELAYTAPVRRAPDAQLIVHQRLLGNDVLIAENLTGLASLVGKRLQVYALPIKIAEGDGAPARICVEIVDH